MEEAKTENKKYEHVLIKEKEKKKRNKERTGQ